MSAMDEEKVNGNNVNSSNCYISGFSKQGAKAWQEDSYFTFTSDDNRVFVGGVFDGHGGFNGLLAAQNCKNVASNFFKDQQLVCQYWDKAEWTGRINQLFQQMHESLRDKMVKNNYDGIDAKPNAANVEAGRFVDQNGVVRQINGDPIHGGTTGLFFVEFDFYIASIVACVWQQNGTRLVVSANVGDTDVILMDNTSNWKRMSEDHGPDSASEWLRINNLDSSKYPVKLLFVYDKASVFRKAACPLVFLNTGEKDPIYASNPYDFYY